MKKLRYRLHMIRQILPLAFGVKRFFWLLAAVGLAATGVGLLTPQFYKLFVERVILGAQPGVLPWVVGGYLVVFAAETALAYAANHATNRLTNHLTLAVRQRIMDNFLALPMTAAQDAGELEMRIDDDTEKLAGFPSGQIIDYSVSGLMVLVTAGILFAIDWRLAAFGVCVAPVTFVLDHLLSKRERHLHDYKRGNDQNMRSWLQNSLTGWKEVKALNLQKNQIRTFGGHLQNFARFYSRWIYYWTARSMVIPDIKDLFFLNFALYFVGGLLILRGHLGIGALLVFMLYYKTLNDHVKKVSAADAELQSNMPYYDRVLDSLRSAPVREGLSLPENHSGDIAFDDVTFRYPGGQADVLTHFDLHIRRGERVAIVGRSGAGKTTVLRLLMAMLDPDAGRVTYGGYEVAQLDTRALYAKIGYVMQENLLFNFSLRENLQLAAPGASVDELRAACRKACLDDFLEGLPQGLDTVIGERGVKLSGGQRQRLVLARLFLRDVEVLVFDEATSALDQQSESVVHTAIDAVSRAKTVIVVAHRQSSIALCDRVIEI